MKSDKKSIGNIVNINIVHIGVDVSKAKLDIYVPAAKEGASPMTTEVDNDIKGLRTLRDMARKSHAVVCVEPTGGYELELISFLHQFDVAVAYADGRRVRQFAKAEGTMSKSDSIDAALISRFADKIGVRIIEKRDVEFIELKRRTKFRLTLIDQRTALKNRLDTEIDEELKSCMKVEIQHLDKTIGMLERKCLELIARNQQKDELRKRFTDVGGVGDVTATSILAGLPEIGTLPDSKLYRLAGVAPEEKSSGTKKGQRQIWGGRKDVRNALYMATIAALIWNSRLRNYYHKKRSEGHSHKWAIVPTMRKLLSLLNRIASDPNFKPASEPETTRRDANVGRKRQTA